MSTSQSIWFVRNNQRVSGPFTSSQLKQLAANNRLRPEMEVRKGEEGKWVTAASVKGLFPIPPPVTDHVPFNEDDTEEDVFEVQVVEADDGEFPADENSEADVRWDELEWEAPTEFVAPPTANHAPPEEPGRPSSVHKILEQAAQEELQDQLAAYKAGSGSRQYSDWLVDGLQAFGAGLLIYLFCCGLFTVGPMLFLSYRFYDAGNDSKAIAFGISGVFYLILALTMLIFFKNLYPPIFSVPTQ